MSSETQKPVVIIIGGGFGGLHAAQDLADAPVSIILIDKHNYHLFQPMLYQVATAEVEPAGIAAPIRQILRKQQNVVVALGEVSQIDLEKKALILPRGELRYDYLVIAAGVQTTYFGHDEFGPFAPGMKSIDDALEIRRRLLMAYEAAELEADEEARRAKLTFVVVGGGPTGVEMSGAIMDAAKRTLPKDFRNIDTSTTRVVLVDGGSRLLKTLPEAASHRVERDLTEMGVEIRLNNHVTEVTEAGVLIGTEHIAAANVFWAAGVQGTPLARSLGVELDRGGRVVVGQDMSIPGHDEAFVIGDAAHAIDAKTGEPVPGVAQGAIQTGKFVAKIIKKDLGGVAVDARPAFSYFDKGSMVVIGRGKAITTVGNRYVGGFLGWLAWSALHAAFLVGFRRKIVIVMAWMWNFIVNERAARIILGDPDLHLKRPVEIYLDGLDRFDDNRLGPESHPDAMDPPTDSIQGSDLSLQADDKR